MNDCVFCKIINGDESERTIIFENDGLDLWLRRNL